MSKSFRYVSEFSFPSEAGYSGSAGKTAVKGYYRGGEKAHTRNVIRNEREELNRVEAKRRDAGQEVKRVQAEMRYDKNELKPMMKKAGGAVKSDMKQTGMIKNKGSLGVVNNKNPGETKKHTAPNLPGKKMAYKEGGACYAKGGKAMAKVGKVMGEYKEGKLHSGSKKGPEVTNRKQAVAIALSEARKAGAKIPMKKYGGGSISDKDYQALQEAARGSSAARGAKAGALNQVAKKVGSRIDEGVSSRPVDKVGRRVTMEQLNRMSRDLGAMSEADIKYMRDAMKRAERVQAEEANESRLLNRARGGYMHGGMHQKKK